MKKNKSTIILILVFFVGLSVMLYPTLSDYVNQLHQSRAVATYAEDVDKLTDADYSAYFGAADDFNAQIAADHLAGTSLPVGGGSTHAVISAHRGLPSAKLFTNLDQLEVGGTFTITVLDRVLTYEVDQISIVLPTETDNLKVTEGRDYVTLMLAALVCGVCRKHRRERRAR